MRRFNAAVEAADALLPGADFLPVPELLHALTFAPWTRSEAEIEAARELEAAAVAAGQIEVWPLMFMIESLPALAPMPDFTD